MFRRSRFSLRPNVGTAGRTAATPQEAPSANQDPRESSSGPAVADDKSVVTPENNTASGDGNDHNVDSSSSSAALQRRKRFSVKPKVAPGRPAPLARTAKSPVKPVSETAVEASGSDVGKPTTSSQPGTAASLEVRSPRRRRPSEDVNQAKVQPKLTPMPSESSAHSAGLPAENSLKSADSGKPLESSSGSQVKEAPPRVPLFIPDREAIELSEKARTLVSSKSKLSLSPSALSLSRLLNDPSDLQRLAKAQKLKELLREERHKEKKLKKAKKRVKEFTLDPTKMTMRDLLRYVPHSNPMKSSLGNSTPEEETVIPASPGREESPERAQQPEVIPEITSPREEEDEEADEEQEDALMVPQVKVAEDGSLIIDEESLTVEVQRAKGPNPADDRDPIFERGSTTTYSSFRKGTCGKPWCSEETDMFFLAISMVGTDFSMICQLFPHRARAEIKNKFKKEERVNAWRIDKAFRERRRLDIEYFSKLLEKIMEVKKNRKKLRSLAEKPPKKRKAKGKKAAKKLSDVDEEEEEDENLLDLDDDDDEERGGKENELCNEGAATASKPKKQQKRKTGANASNNEPSKKKSKTAEKSSEQDESCTLQDAELPEDSKNPDISVNAENADAKDTAVQPAKLSRGRAPKPRLPLGQKWGRKAPPPSTEDKDSGDESVNEDASPSKISANEENSSEDDEAPVALLKPTRYGRVPKPIKPLAYPCKADRHSSAPEPTSSSPEQHSPSAAKPKPKCAAKRGRSSLPQSDQETKQPRLVTLRASQSDDSDEENEQQWEQEEGEEGRNPACSPSKDSTAPAFVPASLRSPQAKISIVEETMEELDILANMPDVLGISQDALCPDASCEQAHNETCDHQLDLLVDVIDFLSSEHTEVAEDESYNEAAQTLLTIGNLHSQNERGTMSSNEASQRLEDKMPPDSAAHEQSATCKSAAFGGGGAESTEVIVPMEQQADSGDNAQICNEPWTGSVPQFQSSPASLQKSSPRTETGDLSMLKLELFQPSGFEQFEQANQETGSISSQAGKSESSSTAFGISVTDHEEEGLNTDSVQGQGDSCQTAAFIGSSVEDLPVSQEAQSEVPSPLQPRRSRLQKVKPNLPQTCRAACSNPQVTKTSKESDGSPASIPQPIAEVEPELSCVTPPEKPTESSGLVSDLEVALNLGTTENQSTAEEKNTDITTFGQVDSGAQASGGSSLENKNISQDNFQPSSEQTRPLSVSVAKSGTTESGSNLGSSEMSCTEPQVEEGSNTQFVPGQGDGGEDLPVSQEARSEVASPLQPRRSRMRKVEPNLPLTRRAARSKPQVTEASKERESNPTPIPKATIEVEPEPSFATLPEQATESTGPVSDLSSSLKATGERSTDERKNTDDATLGQVDSGAAGGSSSENNSQPSIERTTAASASVSESANEKLMSAAENADPPVSQKAERPEPSEDMIVQGEAPSSSSGTAGSFESSTNDKCAEGQKMQVGFALDSSSESSEPSVGLRRRRSVKVKAKPNITSSVKASRSKLHPRGTSDTPDQQHMSSSVNVVRGQQSEHKGAAHSEPEPTERDKSLAPVHSSINSEPLDSMESAAAEMQTSLDHTGEEDASSVLASAQAAEVCSVSTAAVPEKSTGDKMSSDTKMKVKVSAQGCKEDVSTGAAELKTQPPDESVAFSSVQFLKEGSTKSEITSKTESQDAAQQTSETREVHQTSNDKSQCAGSADESQSSGPTICASKARPPRRGRLVKPKPNLARSSQLPKVQQVQKEAQADLKDVDASVSHKSVSELLRPEKKPVEGAAEQQEKRSESRSGGAAVQLGQLNPPSHDAESSVGCSTQVPPAQSVSALCLEASPSHPCLSLFSDMLSEQVPSDPDEPFFILSLTEIPVSSSGEAVDSADEPLSYLPVTDASIPRQSSRPGEHVGAAAGDGSLSTVPVLTSESEETIDVNDCVLVQVTHEKDLIVKNPADEHDESTTVQPPKPVEKNNDAEITPTKLTSRGKARRAKTQVKLTRTKQGSKAFAPNSIQTMQLDACDATANSGDGVVAEPQTESGDQVEIEKETLACAQGSSSKAPDGISSKVQTPHGAGKPSSVAPRNAAPTASPTQPPEEAPSSLSDTSATPTQMEAEHTPTPMTGSSRGTQQVSASLGSDCVQSSSAEEEPTSVSQYFLSDIFTDVDPDV